MHILQAVPQPHPDQNCGNVHYSQNGEDLIIFNIFKDLEIDTPSYLDLGAHHPDIISNTKFLYLRGSRGINIEANPELIAAFKHLRARDVNVNIGVGPTAGTKTFYRISKTSGRNTFSEDEMVCEWVKEGHKASDTIEVQIKTLSEIVAEYCNDHFPDLLNIDIEGFDHSVLETADFSKSFPIVICVELRRDKSSQTIALLKEKGFEPYVRLGDNFIFVHKTYFGLVFR